MAGSSLPIGLSTIAPTTLVTLWAGGNDMFQSVQTQRHKIWIGHPEPYHYWRPGIHRPEFGLYRFRSVKNMERAF